MTPDKPGRAERLMIRLQERWGARRYRRMIGAHLPMRLRRKRALATRAEAPQLPPYAQPGDIVLKIISRNSEPSS